MQLANTPPLQSTASGLHLVSIHQTSPLVRGSKHPITAYYSIYRPQKDESLSRPAWLVTYWNKVPPSGVEPGHVTHPSTSRARCRVTSLIRPTLFPLRHATTRLPGDKQTGANARWQCYQRMQYKKNTNQCQCHQTVTERVYCDDVSPTVNTDKQTTSDVIRVNTHHSRCLASYGYCPR